MHLYPWNSNLYPVRLSAALSCSAQPCVTRLMLKPMPLRSQEWRGIGGAGSPVRAVLTANTTPASAVRLTPSKAGEHAARFSSPVHWRAYGMAPHSHADAPVLEEWHVTSKRPHACGVEGCTAHLITRRHLQARLCAAHIKCPAVLRGGVRQRFCKRCHCFHALGAFSGSRRCASVSRLQSACLALPQGRPAFITTLNRACSKVLLASTACCQRHDSIWQKFLGPH